MSPVALGSPTMRFWDDELEGLRPKSREEAAASWLLEHAADEFGSDRFLIAGESAGAHLAAVTLVRLKDKLGAADRFLGANLVFGAYDLSRTPSQRGVGLVPGTDLLEGTG